jgi:hypothetical protein
MPHAAGRSRQAVNRPNHTVFVAPTEKQLERGRRPELVMRSAHFLAIVAMTLIAAAAPSADVDDYALRYAAGERQEVDVGLVSAAGDQYTVEAWIRMSTVSRSGLEAGEIVGQHADVADAKGTLDLRDRRLGRSAG